MEPSAIEQLLALPALAGLTVVLGMDNILAVSVIARRAHPSQQSLARRLGLGLALVLRLALLVAVLWVVHLASLTFPVAGRDVHLRDLLLASGGLFLIGKSVHELHGATKPRGDESATSRTAPVHRVVIEIVAVDLMLSVDSVVTVAAMAPSVLLMVLAVSIEVGVILLFAEPVARWIRRFPSLEILAICALLLVGVVLTSEAVGRPVDKVYVYSMMLFALFVEAINLRIECAAAARRAAPCDEVGSKRAR